MAEPGDPQQAIVSARSPAANAQASLARLRGSESLEAAYEAWDELREQHRAFRADGAQRRRAIDDRGAFLVGAVREAGGPSSPKEALATGAALGEFLQGAEAKISEARQALDAEMAAGEQAFGDALAAVRQEVAARVRRFAEKARPSLKLILRPAGQGRSILHVGRLSPDESVLALWALSGRVPSRYAYLFDDAVDDLSLPPAALYADEGVEGPTVRPTPAQLHQLLDAHPEVWPVKGHVPVIVPTPAGADLYRMLERGPVMEIELADGAAFRSLLTHEEGQRIAGHLLRQKIEGRIELEVEAG